MTLILLKRLFCSSLLLVLVVGCGKKNASGGGSSSPAALNQLTTNLSASAQKILTEYQQWYNSNTEGPYPGRGVWKEVKKTETFNTELNCSQKSADLKLFKIPYEVCSYDRQPLTTETNDRIVDLIQQSNGVKSSVPGLRNIATLENGSLHLIDITKNQISGKPYYTFNFIRKDGVRVNYIVDTNIHSQFNPVVQEIFEPNQKTVISVTVNQAL
jgi:hypothetical protein